MPTYLPYVAPSGASIPNSIIIAKGDLIAGFAVNDPRRVAVGADGFVLTADAASPLGVKWAAAAGGGIAATIFTAKGSLIGSSAAATPGELVAGVNGQSLVADSTQALGIKWADSFVKLATVTTKGDIYAATGSGAIARVAAGADGLFLMADSTQAVGLSYASVIRPTIGTTKGDLIAFTGSATPVRLGIGSDGQILTADAASAAGMKWAAAAAAAINALAANVVTSESTSSTVYTDLATVGPAVTLTTGATVIVILGCFVPGGSAGATSQFMSYAVSGATTSAATDGRAYRPSNDTTSIVAISDRACALFFHAGLTPGSNTFTAKYKNGSASSLAYVDRTIAVIAL